MSVNARVYLLMFLFWTLVMTLAWANWDINIAGMLIVLTIFTFWAGWGTGRYLH